VYPLQKCSKNWGCFFCHFWKGTSSHFYFYSLLQNKWRKRRKELTSVRIYDGLQKNALVVSDADGVIVCCDVFW